MTEKLESGHYIHITHIESGRVEKTLGPYATERVVDKAEMGVMRNLSDDYYTITEEIA